MVTFFIFLFCLDFYFVFVDGETVTKLYSLTQVYKVV